MFRRGVAATILLNNKRYQLENDGIINVTTKYAEYKEVRVVGVSRGGSLIVIGKEGKMEIPTSVITKIADAKKGEFSPINII